jgi:hypothetical protein
VLVSAVGCAQARSPSRPQPAPTAATTNEASPAPTDKRFCQVKLPDQWRDTLARHKVGRRPGESLIIHTAATDASSVFAESVRSGRREVVWVRNQSGERVTVLVMARPAVEQMSASSYDGRWLVFGIHHDDTNLSNWTLYAWDSQSRHAPKVLAKSRVDQSGQPIAGPILAPIVHNGIAAWSQGTGQDRSELHYFDLAKWQDRVLRTGRPDMPVRYGGGLLWTENEVRDQPTTPRAATFATGELVEVPAPLRAVSNMLFVGASHDTVAWVESYKSIRVWRPGWNAPRTIYSTTIDTENLQWTNVAGEVVTWYDSDSHFAADLRSGSFTQLTPGRGVALTWGDALLVSTGEEAKDGSSRLESSIVPVTALDPLPGC